MLLCKVTPVNIKQAVDEVLSGGGRLRTPQGGPQQADHTKGDTRVGDVERRPVIISPIEKKKINHLAIHDAVDEIPDGARKNPGYRDGNQQPFVFHTIEKEREGHDRNPGHQKKERLAKPPRRLGEQAEGRAGVAQVRQVEKCGDNRDALIQGNGLGDQGLRRLVEQ